MNQSDLHIETSIPADGRQANPGALIEYQHLLDCVHCGLCTASCPTYTETGDENDSPRGRIYLMRAVIDGRLEMDQEVRRHLDLCLDCRACETSCPSGVQYGKLIEPFRIGLQEMDNQLAGGPDWFHRWILFGLFPYPGRMRIALWPARIAQLLRLDRLILASGLWKLLPDRLGRLLTMLPPLPRPLPALPAVLPAEGPKRARVALFTGCVQDVIFRQTNWATARVLQKNGCEVIVPSTQGCCGAIHFHSGSSPEARQLADQNLDAFDPDDVDAIIINVAGCGSMLKDYGHHWKDDQQAARRHFADKVMDISEFLDQLGLIPPEGTLPLQATYHDACHLVHAQGIREQPRNILGQVPDLELIPLPESEICCGAAGTYNLTEPEMASRLSRRKMAHIQSTGAELVITANTGCLMQIDCESRIGGAGIRVLHPMEVLYLSYLGEQPAQYIRTLARDIKSLSL
jgi:glycolate oxidase iron-sulfur subunit